MTPTHQHRPDLQRTVRRIVPGDPITAYRAITDVETTARYSEEVSTAEWVTRANVHAASVGDTFIAHNQISDWTWTSTSTVVAADPGHRFAFAVGGPASPVAMWTFDLTPACTRVLRQSHPEQRSRREFLAGATSSACLAHPNGWPSGLKVSASAISCNITSARPASGLRGTSTPG